MMILGSCSSPINTLVTALHRAGCDHVQTLGDGDVDVHACAHVIVGVRRMRNVAHMLHGLSTVVIVQDAYNALREINGVVIIDHADDVEGWSPCAIRMHDIRSALSALQPIDLVSFAHSDVVDRTVAAARSMGVLGAILAYTQKLRNAGERDAFNAQVIRYLTGALNLHTFERRTKPDRDTLQAHHHDMCVALGSPKGEGLRAAVCEALRGLRAPRECADAHGADLFEVNYTLYHHSANKGVRAT